jgi:hypothetical protein
MALADGAEVVITGRCVDSAVTLGALMHEFGWKADDYDRLASGSLAGHIIECGCQATGGLHTDWEDIPDWAHIGYPIVECHADGSFVVTKAPDTGGKVIRAAVTEQLLYEIGDPGAYLLPDVTCDFRDVTIEQQGPDRVRVSPAKGRPPMPTYKVSATELDGFRCSASMMIIGIDADRKARRTAEAIIERTSEILKKTGQPPFTRTHIEIMGVESLYGPHSRIRAPREAMLRVVANHPRKEALAMFAREVAPSGTSWSPGTTGPGGGRAGVSPLIKSFAFTLDKKALTVTYAIDGQRHVVEIPGGGSAAVADSSPHPRPGAYAEPDEPQEEVRLIELAWARSGDKGNLSNIGLVARRPEWLPLLWSRVTTERVREYFRHMVRGKVERFYLPGTHSMNLLLHDALDGGTSSMRMDPLGKGMGQMLLDMTVPVPRSVARQARGRAW